jgi:hypothetical protein
VHASKSNLIQTQNKHKTNTLTQLTFLFSCIFCIGNPLSQKWQVDMATKSYPRVIFNFWNVGGKIMNDAISALEEIRAEYMRKIEAIDLAISVLKQHDVAEEDGFNKVIKNEPFDFSQIKDMNRNGGGIRVDR